MFAICRNNVNGFWGVFTMVANVGAGLPKGLEYLSHNNFLSKNPSLQALRKWVLGPGQKWWPTALRIKRTSSHSHKIFTCFYPLPSNWKSQVTKFSYTQVKREETQIDIHIDTYAIHMQERKSWVECNPKGFFQHTILGILVVIWTK
jgi:hypothetical protein